MRNGLVARSPNTTNTRQWTAARATPMVAERLAFSALPEPKWMEMAEVMPTPIPMATEVEIFWSGNARDTAVRAWVPSLDT